VQTVTDDLDSVPDVSVVVPAYNASRTLPTCLAALQASAGPTREVIVVDDCSTDDSAAIAAQHGARVVRLAAQSGAAAARNAGARVARSKILFFTDADVAVLPGTLQRVTDTLRGSPDLSALFGSYTAETVHQNFFSVYKNLQHHLTHQSAASEARTFWGAAGAVRTGAFWEVGGFDPSDTRSADVEDIALGYRLWRAGHRIKLDRDLQVVHAKRYSLLSLIRSDVVHRAIPWTRLMLRERIAQRDLNTSPSALVSALTVATFVVVLAAAAVTPYALVGAMGLLSLFLLLNRKLFTGYFRHRGVGFLVAAIGMTALYYVYATVGAFVGLLIHLFAAPRRHRSSRPVPPAQAGPSTARSG
jgi:glycosyltransferase involved in cell wall biosynthesis